MKASLNENCFAAWTSENAWLFGYIWADGSIGYRAKQKELTFICSTTDEILLEQVKSVLQSTARIRRYPAKYQSGYLTKPTSRLYITSEKLVHALMSLGIPPRKSFCNPPCPAVPDSLFRYFALGVHDGDGWYTYSRGRGKLGFCGSPQFIADFRQQMCRLAGVSSTRIHLNKKGTCAVLRWESLADLLKLHAFLQPEGCRLGLHRKWHPLKLYLLEKMKSPFGQRLLTSRTDLVGKILS